MIKRSLAEMIGTFWLALGGCGAAVFAAGVPDAGIVILGVTDKRGTAVAGGLAIGLALTLIHLISIPVTNTSVNPARSTGPALALAFAGEGTAFAQLWLFWVAPVVGTALAGVLYRLFDERQHAAAGQPLGLATGGSA